MLYLHKYSIITPHGFGIPDVDRFDHYQGDLDKCIYEIERRQYKEGKIYNGHLIVNVKKPYIGNIMENIDYFTLDERSIYVPRVVHSGIDKECKVDTGIILCSSWVLPILGYNLSSNNNLYGDLIARRIRIKKLSTVSLDTV